MEKKVQVNDNSIKTAGLPSNYTEAIAEFIWNGFDAGASTVSVDFTADAIGGLSALSISDNGEGIKYDHLEGTFGAFLDSEKTKEFRGTTSYLHGKKGKGRFSFQMFSHEAQWITTFKKESEYLQYELIIRSSKKDYFEASDPKTASQKKTGTKVLFKDIYGITSHELNSEVLINFLRSEFGWFLYLNKNKDFKLLLNNKPLDYNKIIADSESFVKLFEDSKGTRASFRISYIRWNDKIGDKLYYYFLNDEKIEKAKKLTSFNNKADDFYHSIYVESEYFNDFQLNEGEENQPALLAKNQTDKAFKSLIEDLKAYLTKKRKEFLRGNSDILIKRFESEGVMPEFKDNKYDQARKSDFVEVVKEIYSVEPKIFTSLNEEQKKSFLGLLNLLLDTEERENIMQIIDSVVNGMSAQERKSLAEVLKKTSLTKIVRTIKLIEARYQIVELLKNLVFDLRKFTTERDHIQKAIEENYWLFGEQYHLVSADKTFEAALSEYLYILDGSKDKNAYKIDNPDRLRRPDIFMCQKNNIPDNVGEGSEIEENIIVELKRPEVTIGKEQYRQVEDYLKLISTEERFNSEIRTWKFYLIGNKLDSDIIAQKEAFKDKGKRFLVYQVGKLEIYAMSWDDVFRVFDIKHRYLLEKLDFDKKALQEELEAEGINFGQSTASSLITKKIVKKSKDK